jgi:ABC-2 type transport system ATP-binding protein
MGQWQTMIQTDSISKTYSTHLFEKKIPALNDISLHVNKGEVFGIIGPNGAGKSTLIKILLGFIQSDSGSVTINGLAPSDTRSRSNIGYLPESPCLYPQLTLIDHLRFSSRVTGDPFDKSWCKNLLDKVDLAHVSRKPLAKYSKGMVQRAALAYALFHNPDILILDEPMSGLDPVGRHLVVQLIKEYHQKGHTILFCSHILSDVENICDKVGLMNHGSLVKMLTPDAVSPGQQPPEQYSIPLERQFFETLAEQEQHTP